VKLKLYSKVLAIKFLSLQQSTTNPAASLGPFGNDAANTNGTLDFLLLPTNCRMVFALVR
jgi:hypothetical protein